MTFNKLKREAEKLQKAASELNRKQVPHSNGDSATFELYELLSRWLGANK